MNKELIMCLKKRNSRSNIQSVSVVKLIYSIFMSIDTSITSPNSHLFHIAFILYAFTKAKNNLFSSILSIYDNR